MIKPKKMKAEDKDILERIIHNLKTELDKLKESNQTLYQSCSQKNYDIKELQSQLEKERAIIKEVARLSIFANEDERQLLDRIHKLTQTKEDEQ